MDLAKIFDSPRPAPVPTKPFRPFPEPYLAGLTPAHLAHLTLSELTAQLTRIPLDEAVALVEFGSIWLNDRPCFNPKQKLSLDLPFRLNPPAYGPVRFYEADPERIVYEDQDLLIYNKESGRPSQAVPHDAHNNVLTAMGRLLQARGDRSSLWLSHRLDADTSGLLMMAKNKDAAGAMGRAFQNGQVAKEYLALGLGPVPKQDHFTVNQPIAKENRRYVVKPGGPGLQARTDFCFLGQIPGYATDGDYIRGLFLGSPLTGRTHQVRLHLAWAGWPLVGDPFYGRLELEAAAPAPRLMLASASLRFPHPRRKEELKITLPAWK